MASLDREAEAEAEAESWQARVAAAVEPAAVAVEPGDPEATEAEEAWESSSSTRK
jgi:hypothetical protein